MKLQNPDLEKTVMKQDSPHETFGCCIVCAEQTLESQQLNNPGNAETIHHGITNCDDIDVQIHGKVFRSGGHGF